MKDVEVVFNTDPGQKDIKVTVSASARDEQVEALIDLIRNSGDDNFFVRNQEGDFIRLKEDRIIRIQAYKKNASVTTDSGEYLLHNTLQEAEKMLHGSSFLKISRFEIINLQKIKSFDFAVSGTLRIEFEDGSYTWASRRYIPTIRQILSERKGEL